MLTLFRFVLEGLAPVNFAEYDLEGLYTRVSIPSVLNSVTVCHMLP
jgi:hypothetical protein